MLTYEEKVTVTVKLDGKVAGHITEVKGWWQYVPKGCSREWGGDVYPTLKEVKLSLED